MNERKDESINVRLDQALKERADSVSRACGTTPSMLIRLLLERFIEHSERNGGRVVMPPEFENYEIARHAGAVAEPRAKYGRGDSKGHGRQHKGEGES
jgi:hypothetical protein